MYSRDSASTSATYEPVIDAVRVQLDAGADRIALFELARVYLPSGEPLPDERWRVAGIAQGGDEAREVRRCGWPGGWG